MILFKKIDDKIQCLLCPHLCVLKKDEVGKCHARHNKNKKIQHIHLGAISSLAVDPIEKKPFKRFLEKTKTLTIGSYSCNLNCQYCENHIISQKSPLNDSRIIYPSELIEVAIEKHCKSITMSYNEPILSYEYLISVAEESALKGLQFALKTNAFVNQDPWREICSMTHALNVDWKGSEDKFKFITGVDKYVLQDRIKEAYDNGVHLEISFPLYYQDDEIEDEMKIAGEFLSSISRDIPCHLLRISPSYKYSDFIFKSENMDRAKSVLSKYMNNIYVVV